MRQCRLKFLSFRFFLDTRKFGAIALVFAMAIAVPISANAAAKQYPMEPVAATIQTSVTWRDRADGCSLTTKPTGGKESGAGILLALGSVLLKPAVDYAVQYFADYLKKREDKKSGIHEARSNSFLYEWVDGENKPEIRISCLQISRGVHGDSVSNDVRLASGQYFSKKEDLINTGLVEVPEFYLEAFVFSATGDSGDTVVRLVPQLLFFRKTVAERGDTKDLHVTISMSSPVKQELKGEKKEGETTDVKATSGNTFAVTNMVFKAVKEGTYASGRQLQAYGAETPWFVLPALSDGVPTPGSGQVLKSFPFTTLAIVEEKEKGDPILLKTSEILSEKKDEIVKVIVNEVRERTGMPTAE